MYNQRDMIKEKRREKLTKGILLLHDNAPIHTTSFSKVAPTLTSSNSGDYIEK